MDTFSQFIQSVVFLVEFIYFQSVSSIVVRTYLELFVSGASSGVVHNYCHHLCIRTESTKGEGGGSEASVLFLKCWSICGTYYTN